MKKINPVQIWKNGKQVTAEVLNARIISDDLYSSAVFYWELRAASITVIPEEGSDEEPREESGEMLAEGNVSLSGSGYLSWDGSNDYAYEFIASQINVTISEN